jgi:flagellar hook-basal body complex protein FliE
LEINGLTPFMPIQSQPAQNMQTPAEVTKGFSAFLSDALEKVNQAQVDSSRMADQFAAGNAEIHQVTIAGQKASVMLELTIQVRNKVIESYQEIMRMSI